MNKNGKETTAKKIYLPTLTECTKTDSQDLLFRKNKKDINIYEVAMKVE